MCERILVLDYGMTIAEGRRKIRQSRVIETCSKESPDADRWFLHVYYGISMPSGIIFLCKERLSP